MARWRLQQNHTGTYRTLPESWDKLYWSPELIRQSWFDDEVEKYYVNKIENSNCVCTQNANDILELLCWNSNSIWLTLEVCFEEWRAVPEEEEVRHWVVWRQKPRGWVARSLKVGPLGIWSWNLCSGFDFAWLLFFWFPTNQSGSNFFYSLKEEEGKPKWENQLRFQWIFTDFRPVISLIATTITTWNFWVGWITNTPKILWRLYHTHGWSMIQEILFDKSHKDVNGLDNWIVGSRISYFPYSCTCGKCKENPLIIIFLG